MASPDPFPDRHALTRLSIPSPDYISSTSRISAGNTSSRALTPESAIACLRSAAFLSAAGLLPPDASAAEPEPALPDISATTESLRPASRAARASSAGRYLSNAGPTFWAAANVRTTRSPSISIVCACAMTVLYSTGFDLRISASSASFRCEPPTRGAVGGAGVGGLAGAGAGAGRGLETATDVVVRFAALGGPAARGGAAGGCF